MRSVSAWERARARAREWMWCGLCIGFTSYFVIDWWLNVNGVKCKVKAKPLTEKRVVVAPEKPIECSWNSCNFTIAYRIYIMWRVCRATANFQQIKKLYTKQRGICTRVVEHFQFNTNTHTNWSRPFRMRKWISSVKRKQARCLMKEIKNIRKEITALKFLLEKSKKTTKTKSRKEQKMAMLSLKLYAIKFGSQSKESSTKVSKQFSCSLLRII